MGISIKQIAGVLIVLWTLIFGGLASNAFANSTNVLDKSLSHEELQTMVNLTNSANTISRTTDGKIILSLQ